MKYNKFLKECEKAFDTGLKDPDYGIRRTGELLADADSEYFGELARLGEDSDEIPKEQIKKILLASSFHCLLLSQNGHVKESLSTRLMTLITTLIAAPGNREIDALTLSHFFFMFREIVASLPYLGLNPEENPEDAEHLEKILSYVASVMAFYHNLLKTNGEKSEIMDDVERLLGSLSNIIQKPTIDVNGSKVDPSEDLPELMADLAGRMIAVGLAELEA